VTSETEVPRRTDDIDNCRLVASMVRVMIDCWRGIPMTFPPSDRTPFRLNPLADVTFEVAYSRDLRVESTPPAEFHSSLKSRFPEVSDRHVPAVPEIAKQIASAVLSKTAEHSVDAATRREWVFEGDDGVVTLSSSNTSLATHNYSRWDRFVGDIRLVANALDEVYGIKEQHLLSLRYRNIIMRSALELPESMPWDRLISAPFIGELADPLLRTAITSSRRMMTMTLDDGTTKCRLQHGLAKAEYEDGTIESVYVIDSCFICELDTDWSGVFERLDHFNKQAGNLFRWMLTDELIAHLGTNAQDDQ